MKNESIYRCEITFTDERCKGQSGGNLFLRAKTANDAGKDAIYCFQQELAKNNYSGVAFEVAVFQSSEKQAAEYGKAMKNSRVN
jgi:hypothetical protein